MSIMASESVRLVEIVRFGSGSQPIVCKRVGVSDIQTYTLFPIPILRRSSSTSCG